MNIFNKVKINAPKYNKFDLSHERKLSMNMGDLIPILVEEIVPGDKFRVKSEIFMRLAPMQAPVMHRVHAYTHYFFVPNRLVWDNWKTFITGGEDGLQTAVAPYLNIDEAQKQNFGKGSLADYMGIPAIDPTITITDPTTINALPFRAYAEIYNEYYRDQNVTPKVDYGKNDGAPISTSIFGSPYKRAWEKDYFTSALPWPQRGADVTLPVDFEYKDVSDWVDNGTGTANTMFTDAIGDAGNIKTSALAPDGVGRVENLVEDGATSVTINELRTATRLQEWLEKNARAGSRYIEQILSHFGVRSSDARLQRPEYLGGGKTPVIISEVLQQSATSSDVQEFDTPLGEMGGHGVSVGKTNTFTKRFEEHGFVIGILSVIPRTCYQQGLNRMWSRRDKLEYYWPEFAHLGEQEIKQQELYYDPTAAPLTKDGTFGYTPRYAEYKYQQSSVHGEFRDTLKYWHMGRTFDTAPALNTEFIESNPTHDIFAVIDPSEDKLYVQIFNQVEAIRPMPYFGTPYL